MNDCTVTRILDVTSDTAVVTLATWTVVYHVALLTHLSSNAAIAVWLVATLVTTPRIVGHRVSPSDTPWSTKAESFGPRGRTWSVGLLLTGAAAAYLVASQSSVEWRIGWLFGLLLVGAGWILPIYRSRSAPDLADEPPKSARPDNSTRRWEKWEAAGAATLATGLAALSMFSIRLDSDDVFYVNKSAWVADTGTFSTQDTMFSDQSLTALPGAGLPVQSVESFYGAVAHVFGLQGGTVVYLVVPPVATFLGAWAMWRLIRAWSRRVPLAALTVAVAYLVWGFSDSHTFGEFVLARIWQGKATFLAMLIPLVYLYLTRWSRSRDARTALMLLAAGIAGVGLTSSATFLLVFVGAAISATLFLARGVRWCWGPLLLAVYPVLSGVAVVLNQSGGSQFDFGTMVVGESAFHFVLGVSAWAALSWLGIVFAPRLVRHDSRLVVSGAALLACIVYAPGVVELLNSVTGAGPVLWRLVWVAPVPIFVGLLATAGPSLPRFSLPASVATTMAMVVIVAIVGASIWRPAARGPITFSESPAWKYDSVSLKEAGAILELDPKPGPVLAPLRTMSALTIATTHVHAVSPRNSYTRAMDEGPRQTRARLQLARLMTPHPPHAVVQAARANLDLLDVSMACVRPHQDTARRTLKAAGYDKVRHAADLTCLTPFE